MNNLIEQWIKWEPINGVSGKYRLDSIEYGIGKPFSMVFSHPFGKTRKLRVVFEDGMIEHRCTRIDSRINFARAVGQEVPEDWTFFKIMNSSYLQWLRDESYGFYASTEDNRNHFAFIATNFIVDIEASLKYDEHVIEWI